MTEKAAQIIFVCVAACMRLGAQSAEVYTSYYYAADGGTIYATSTMDASMQSGTCTHTYNYSVGLGGPPGTSQIESGSGYWQGLTTVPYSGTVNSQIASSIPGTYNMSSSGTAFCSCIYETYYTDPWTDPTILLTGPPTINSGGIGVYPTGGSGEIYTVEPGTSGQLAIYGTYLTAGGQDLSPAVTATNGISITGLTSVQDGQLNVSYNAANATPGTAYVTVKTNVGQTSPPQGSIAVGDMTPVITSISQSSFVVGVSQATTVSGMHFGTNCKVTLPFATSAISTSQCTDTSVTVTLTPSSAGTGNLTLTAEGYGGLGWAQEQQGEAQAASTAVSAVPVAMKLSLVGPITISTDGLYSENATIQIAAVRSDNGASVPFPFPVYLSEDGTSIYSQNGGTLPAQVPNPINLSASGTAQVVAKSLAGPDPKTNLAPGPALIKSSNFQAYGGDLSIPQWIISGAVIDPRATGQVYDWFQSRSRDIFASATGTAAIVLSAMSSYSLAPIVCGNPLAGGCTPQKHSPTSPSSFTPFATSVRINSPAQTYPTTCGVYRDHEFADMFNHEARHGYQFSLTVNKSNDVDQDYLVDSIPIAPTTIFLDAAAPRVVCNPPNLLPPMGYLGDLNPDPWTLVLYALEEDAYTYVGLTVP